MSQRGVDNAGHHPSGLANVHFELARGSLKGFPILAAFLHHNCTLEGRREEEGGIPLKCRLSHFDSQHLDAWDLWLVLTPNLALFVTSDTREWTRCLVRSSKGHTYGVHKQVIARYFGSGKGGQRHS